MQFMQDRLALWIMGHLIKPQWGCVLWEQRKCSSLECGISWTSLKATVTPAGQVKLFNCNELEALEEINDRRAPWSDWDGCPLKVNYLCEGQQGSKILNWTQTWPNVFYWSWECHSSPLTFGECEVYCAVSRPTFTPNHTLSSCSTIEKELHTNTDVQSENHSSQMVNNKCSINHKF